MKKIIILVLLFALGFYSKKFLFPSDEELITQKIDQLVNAMNTSGGESVIALAQKIDSALEVFDPPIVAEIDLGEMIKSQLFQTKADLKNTLLAIKRSKAGSSARKSQLKITLDGGTATSLMNLMLDYKSNNTFDLFKIQIQWIKKEGQWYAKEIFAAFDD